MTVSTVIEDGRSNIREILLISKPAESQTPPAKRHKTETEDTALKQDGTDCGREVADSCG